ncbi:hypothetical protein [Desulfosarcina ovata]|uniref:hypothetical protein n=1 Tax=Desulfosarcina ovata TaxID=83564 RepID=UPI0012D2FABD|nr:hypothetical protein [Desulfosarcina ovata]
MQPIDPAKIQPVLKPEVSLRPFPYPFQAALAIASDIDRCDRSTFVQVHRYLNGTRSGLGLPISDSFFGTGKPHHMAYFLEDGRTPSEDAELIRCCLESGLIDTLHSWGAFDFQPPREEFLRPMAQRLMETLSARGLRVSVWSNHGAPINFQNLYVRTRPEFVGDDPGSDYYTADLLDNLGIKFYWGGELVALPLSSRRTFSTVFMERRHQLETIVKNFIKRLLERSATQRNPRMVLHLCYPTTLRDNHSLLQFTRYNRHPSGVWGHPTRHTLRYALDSTALRKLIARQGYQIVYTHLGMPHDGSLPLFPEEDAKALETLADHYHQGRIWVATTSVLLNYWLAVHHLRWSAVAEGEKVVIRIIAIDDPVTGPRIPSANELAGITFYSPRPHDTIIYLDDRVLPARAQPADTSGQPSVELDCPNAPEIDFLAHFSSP